MLFTDTPSAAKALDEFIEELPPGSKLKVLKANKETAAKGSIDVNAELDNKFLRVIDFVKDGFAWVLLALSGANLDTSSLQEYDNNNRLGRIRFGGNYSVSGHIFQPVRYAEAIVGMARDKESMIRRLIVSPKGTAEFGIALTAPCQNLFLRFTKPKARYGQERSAQDVAAINDADAKLRKLWAASVAPIFKKNLPKKPGEEVTISIPMKSILGVELPGMMSGRVDTRLAFPEELASLKSELDVSYEVTVKVDEDAYSSDEENAGKDAAEFTVSIMAVVRTSSDFVSRATNTNEISSTMKGLYWLYLKQALKMAFDQFTPRKKGEKTPKVIWPPAIHNPMDARKTAQRFTRAFPSQFKPRVDGAGWTIMRDGSFTKLSEASSDGTPMVEYVKELSDLASRLELAKPSNDPNSENTPEAISDKLVQLGRSEKYGKRFMMADWVNDRLVSMTENGTLAVEMLDGTMALTNAATLRAIDSPVYTNKSPAPLRQPLQLAIAMATAHADGKAEAAIKALDRNRDDYYSQANAIRGAVPDLRTINKRLTNNWRDPDIPAHTVCLKHIAGLSLSDFDDIKPEAKRLTLLEDLASIREALKQTFAEWRTASVSYGDSNRYGTPGWIIETVATITPDKVTKLREIRTEESGKKSPRKLPPNFSVPNFKPGMIAMPHQADVVSVEAQGNKNTIIAVGTGGGKYILGLIDAVLKIRDQGCKRVLTVTKENLIAQDISKLNEFSGGRINAFPLTPEVVKDLIAANPAISKFDAFVKYIQEVSQKAPNTVFYTGHNNLKLESPIFEDEETETGYVTSRDTMSQFAILMRAIGFDGIIVDEAHIIKNYEGSPPKDAKKQRSPGVKRSISNGVQYAASNSTFKTVMSGTFTENVAADWHGVLAFFDPSSVGNRDDFNTKFGLDKNAANVAFKDALLATIADVGAYVSKSREDWAFMLPTMKQHFHDVRLTEKQSRFYFDMLAEVQRKIEERLKKDEEKNSKSKKSRSKVKAPVPVVDEDEEESEGDGTGDDGVDEDETIVRDIKLMPELAALEMFLIAPDYEDEKRKTKNRFRQLAGDDKPSGDDLISPHIKGTAQIIRDHFASGRTDKVIVYLYHQVGVDHFEKHLPTFLPAFADNIVVYRAGHDHIVRKFQEDSNVKIIIAAETSIKEGFDLQVGGRVIRTQGLWNPGAVEQALARIFRPDFKGGMREVIDHDWIMAYTHDGKPTIDLIKACRMFSKEYQGAVLRYSRDDTLEDRERAQRWQNALLAQGIDAAGFKLFKINDPKMLSTFTRDAAAKYMRSNAAIIAFEAAEGYNRKIELARRVEAATKKSILADDPNNHGHFKIIDMATFKKHTMIGIGTTIDLPGSKHIYTPWLVGSKPADPHNLSLEMGAVGNADKKIKAGQHVVTEFGPGKVVRALAAQAEVEVGHGKVKLPYALIAYPQSPEGVVKLEKMFDNLAEHALVPPGAKLVNVGTKSGKSVPKVAVIKKPTKGDKVKAQPLDVKENEPAEGEEPQEDIAPKPKKVPARLVKKPSKTVKDSTPVRRGATKKAEDGGEDETGGLALRAVVADGMPALVMPIDGVDLADHSSVKWYTVGPYIAYKPRTPQAALAFFEELQAKFLIPDSRATEIESLLTTYKKRRKMVADHKPDPKSAMVFFREANQKANTDDPGDTLKPYLFSWGTEVRLAFPLKAQQATAISKLTRFFSRNKSEHPSIIALPKSTGFKIAFFQNYSALEKEVEVLKAAAEENGIDVDAKGLKATLAEAKKLYGSIQKTAKTAPIKANEKTTSKKKDKDDDKKSSSKSKDDKKATSKKKGKDDGKKVVKKPAAKKASAKSKDKDEKKAVKKAVKKPATKAADKKAVKKPAAKAVAKKKTVKKPAKKATGKKK